MPWRRSRFRLAAAPACPRSSCWGTATGLNIWVASFAGIGWYVAFAPNSGGPFARLKRPDGSGADFIVTSLASGGVTTIANKPSNYGRMETSGNTASSSVSVFITETRA